MQVVSPIPCPYFVGARFHLRVSTTSSHTFEISVAVIDVFAPFTISPVMKVKLDDSNILPKGQDGQTSQLPNELILKLFDRRFAYSLRAYHKVGPANYETEEAYQNYVDANPAPDHSILDQQMAAAVGIGYQEPEEAPQYLREHIVTLRMQYYFEDECAVYKHLSYLQGIDIPIFYGATEFVGGLPIPGLSSPIQGVLIEVIPGVTLDKLDSKSADVDSFIQDALRIVRTYTELSMVNEDPRLGNFIAKPDSGVVIIDFAQSRLRDENDDDEEWMEARRNADEENRLEFEAEQLYNRPWVRNRQFSRVETGEIVAVAGSWTIKA